MKPKSLLLSCWVLVVLGAVLMGFNFASQVTRPYAGFDYSRATALVTNVIPGSPADQAGVRPGDRIVTWNGHAVGRDVMPLFFARAYRPLELVVERGPATLTLTITPITHEAMRREHLRGDPGLALPTISDYLHFPLHVWMLGLAVLLLILRPDDKDARIAAMAFACWAGSTFLYRLSGFGTLLTHVPQVLQGPMVLIDAILGLGFFAFVLHLSIVFPSEHVRVRRGWEVLPYVVALPILIETMAHGLRRLHGDVRPAALPWDDAYSTAGGVMLLAALGMFAMRFVRLRDANARRRLKMIFLALLPATVTFLMGSLVDVLELGRNWDLAVRLLHRPATLAGSAIFAYAVVRHRLFDVRVLVRRSLQYAMARGTLLVLTSLPLIGLAAFLWIHRSESLAGLLTGAPAFYLLLLLPLLLAMRYRKPLLEALDRRFFREQYDARQLLLHVVSIIRGGSDLRVVSRAALDEIDRALHPKHLSLWQLDPAGAALHPGFSHGEIEWKDAEPLSTTGTLAALLSADDDPLDVQSRHSRALLQRLPEAERAWLTKAQAHLLVPLLIEKRLAGLMVLGERRSEEPYSGEDRQLLRTLGGQLALTLDYARLKQSPSLVWSASTPTAPIFANASDVLQLCPLCGRCYAEDAVSCPSDGEGLIHEAGVPRTIDDKYVVTRLLGRGGMGSVYLATQNRLNRPVAIKVLLAHLSGSSTMRSRFEREARIVARLRHPAIVTIHDFGVLPSGHAYLVMEHLDGETLRRKISTGPQTFENALVLMQPVGDAVNAAHIAGVLHRDLKPENIMVVREHDGRMTPRVLDFGLAKMTGPLGEYDSTQAQSGRSSGLVGTLLYMAPEVLTGGVADSRADQYSFALIIYELLLGEHPLGKATNVAAIIRGHTELPMPPIGERAKVPRNAAAAIDRALSKKPEERFETVAEFVGAMGQA